MKWILIAILFFAGCSITGNHTVTYKVSSTSSTAVITYKDGAGIQYTITNSVPWNLNYSTGSNCTLYLAATTTNTNFIPTVTVEIDIDNILYMTSSGPAYAGVGGNTGY